jgi:hypothetical protein
MAMLLMPLIAWCGRGSAWRGVVAAEVMTLGLFDMRLFYLGCFMAGGAASRLSLRCRALEGRVPQWLGKVSYSLYRRITRC